ncbi:hypothetical protein BDV27DRAFT_105491 [Aspergillus caelatus]|uniref:Uncharacterized protein n=2 Tax=Aspergillus subgen. Circumdati TaxID=2720871 RepID=A0A5N7A876_9EURO|nr:uncharacterized protein BDV27DRAFT_105491 [Aspergillus caelatus]KAE8365329.1 hypothetical protein BDV27DRAFT_105491 [Aspergillus caelatus]KAE8413148.1 hypothetical protein BDV36DRAFT_300263 [Aspergillus pseudocaelatus]
MADKYKPSEHGGLREDGQPDKRTQQTEFAYGKVDPTEAGQEGGSVGGTTSQGKGSGGSAQGEFAHGKVNPREAGSKGGHTLGDD